MGFCPVGFWTVGLCPDTEQYTYAHKHILSQTGTGILSVGFCPVGFWTVGFCPWDFVLWDFGLWDYVRIPNNTHTHTNTFCHKQALVRAHVIWIGFV